MVGGCSRSSRNSTSPEAAQSAGRWRRRFVGGERDLAGDRGVEGQSLRAFAAVGLAAIERVNAAGGRSVSVQDGLDTSTDSGRLVLHSCCSSRRGRATASARNGSRRAPARSSAASTGRPAARSATARGGRAAVGQPPTPPRPSQRLDRRRANGESFSSLARSLEEQNGRTSARPTATWLDVHLDGEAHPQSRLLGRDTPGRAPHEPAHWPVVDAATWQAAQHPRRLVLLQQLQPGLLARLVRSPGGHCTHPTPDLGCT